MIRKKLRECRRQIRFRAEVAKPANLRQLLNYGCRMLHYTGHGSSEFLAFESNHDKSCGIMEPLHVRLNECLPRKFIRSVREYTQHVDLRR